MTILLQFIKFTLRLQKFTKVHTPTIFYTSVNTSIKKKREKLFYAFIKTAASFYKIKD